MRRATVSRRPPPPPLTTSRRPGERSRPRDVSPAAYGIPALVAAGVFLVAYDNGTYDDVARLSLAVGVWWFVLLAVAVGLLPLARPPRAAVLAGFFLAGLAALAFASVGWSTSAERAFTEFDRTALFFGIFVLVVMLGKPGTSGRFADGIALGITAIGLLALAARCFPNVISETDYSTVLPSAYTRLSYPLGYWNGLGIFTGISFPLLLRAALVSRRLLLRGLALAPLPALAAVIYLTSSRGRLRSPGRRLLVKGGGGGRRLTVVLLIAPRAPGGTRQGSAP